MKRKEIYKDKVELVIHHHRKPAGQPVERKTVNRHLLVITSSYLIFNDHASKIAVADDVVNSMMIRMFSPRKRERS